MMHTVPIGYDTVSVRQPFSVRQTVSVWYGSCSIGNHQSVFIRFIVVDEKRCGSMSFRFSSLLFLKIFIIFSGIFYFVLFLLFVVLGIRVSFHFAFRVSNIIKIGFASARDKSNWVFRVS